MIDFMNHKHLPETIQLFNFISKLDLEEADDYFGWKSGGDGDNGEVLMNELDEYFKIHSYFRWHSLAANEYDIPEMGVGVETLVINKNGETFYDHNWIIPGGKWARVGNAANVIKWRYIE